MHNPDFTEKLFQKIGFSIVGQHIYRDYLGCLIKYFIDFFENDCMTIYRTYFVFIPLLNGLLNKNTAENTLLTENYS